MVMVQFKGMFAEGLIISVVVWDCEMMSVARALLEDIVKIYEMSQRKNISVIRCF